MSDVWGPDEDQEEQGTGVWRDPGGTLHIGQRRADGGQESVLTHHRCVVYCRRPRPGRPMRGLFSRGIRCPDCYGRAVSRSIYGTTVEPEPTRLGRLFGYLLCAWLDAMEVLRWHPHRPLVSLAWRVPRYLECPEECCRGRALGLLGEAIGAVEAGERGGNDPG